MCLFPSLGLFPSFFLCSLSIDGTGEVVPLTRETEELQHKEKNSQMHNDAKKITAT